MITPKVKRLYDNSIKDTEFNKAIEVSNKGKHNMVIRADSDKTLCAATYYGWLLARKNIKWEDV